MYMFVLILSLMFLLAFIAYRFKQHESVLTGYIYNIGDVFICYFLFNMAANTYVSEYHFFFNEQLARPAFAEGIIFHAPSAIFAAVVVLVLYHVFGTTERVLTAIYNRLPSVEETEETEAVTADEIPN